MEDQTLRDYFKFDEADLSANRAGRLTAKQTQKLKGDQSRGRLIGGLIALVLLVISLVFPILFLPPALAASRQGQTGAAVGNVIIALVWFVIWGLMGVAVFYVTFVFQSNAGPAVLKSVTGPIELTSVQRRANDRYHTLRTQPVLRIGTVGFDVRQDLFDRLRAGDRYSVYYVGGEIFSLEWQGAPDPQAAPPSAAPATDADARILVLIKRGDKLGAIKLHREIYNSNLAEARGAVEALGAGAR